jgi:5-methylcytosine-specific restriction endonuclease McrA
MRPRRPTYGATYRAARRILLAGDPPCVHCGAPATTADHVPALIDHTHVEGTGCCALVPACRSCNLGAGARITHRRRARGLGRGSGWSTP